MRISVKQKKSPIRQEMNVRNMSWISKISETVNEKLGFVRKALPVIPPVLLICEAHNRPGLSAIALSAAVIKRLPEIGIALGANPDGSPNVVSKFVRVLCEEIVTEIKDNLSVQVSLPIGSISVTGVGANAAGPVTVQATNIRPLSALGIGS